MWNRNQRQVIVSSRLKNAEGLGGGRGYGKQSLHDPFLLFDEEAMSYISEDKDGYSSPTKSSHRGRGDGFEPFFNPSQSGRHPQTLGIRANQESFPSVASSTNVSYDPTDIPPKSTILPKISLNRQQTFTTDDSLNVSDDSILLMEDLQEEPVVQPSSSSSSSASSSTASSSSSTSNKLKE